MYLHAVRCLFYSTYFFSSHQLKPKLSTDTRNVAERGAAEMMSTNRITRASEKKKKKQILRGHTMPPQNKEKRDRERDTNARKSLVKLLSFFRQLFTHSVCLLQSDRLSESLVIDSSVVIDFFVPVSLRWQINVTMTQFVSTTSTDNVSPSDCRRIAYFHSKTSERLYLQLRQLNKLTFLRQWMLHERCHRSYWLAVSSTASLTIRLQSADSYLILRYFS